MIDFAKLDKLQLKAWMREQDKARLADLFKTVLLNPVVTLVGAFVAVDYLEYHTWPKYEIIDGQRVQVDGTNSMLGPAAANVIRAGLIASPVMDALGKVAEVASDFARLKALKGGT